MTAIQHYNPIVLLGNNSQPSEKYKNVISEALKVNNFTKNNSYVNTGIHFGVSRGRIYQLNKIAKNLPQNFIKKYKNCKNPLLLNFLSGKKLLDIVSLENPKKIYSNIADLGCYLEVLGKVA